jgi:hypothetical protein
MTRGKGKVLFGEKISLRVGPGVRKLILEFDHFLICVSSGKDPVVVGTRHGRPSWGRKGAPEERSVKQTQARV